MKSGDGGPTPQRSHKAQRRVGAGLSLDKFAAAGVSKYDKRQVIERQRKEKIIKHSKYSKLKHKLEAQGVLKPLDVKDRVRTGGGGSKSQQRHLRLCCRGVGAGATPANAHCPGCGSGSN